MNKNTELQIVELYKSGFGPSKIVKKLNLKHRYLIYPVLYQHHVKLHPNRPKGTLTRDLDESVFDTVNEASAYWVGFLMADGCVWRPPSGMSQIVRLALSTRDVGHLVKFRDFLKSDHTIHYSKDKTYATVQLSSDKIVNKLISYGVVPRKTRIAKVIGLELNRHFWRGVVDGDGHIGISPTCKPHISVTGSKPLMTQLSRFITSQMPNCKLQLCDTRKSFAISTTGLNATYIIEILYHDCTTYLDRKYHTALDIMERGYFVRDEARFH